MIGACWWEEKIESRDRPIDESPISNENPLKCLQHEGITDRCFRKIFRKSMVDRLRWVGEKDMKLAVGRTVRRLLKQIRQEMKIA